jgi:hypothetical protein
VYQVPNEAGWQGAGPGLVQVRDNRIAKTRSRRRRRGRFVDRRFTHCSPRRSPFKLTDPSDWHEQLEKLGVKVNIIKPEPDGGFIYEVAGKLDALHQAQVVDAQGKPLETGGSSSFSDGESLHREISLEKPLPADAKLKLSLIVKAENVPVAFELKDLKLP